MGYLAEIFIAIVVVLAVLFVVTLVRKLTQTKSVQRGGYVWAALAVYVVSVICGLECAAISLTNDFHQTTIIAGTGTALAVSALILAIRARGAGRVLAIVSAACLTVIWLPMFFGRVVLR
jgi:hypothetical protein